MLELKWDGKDDSLKVPGKVSLRLLDFDSSLSHGEKNSGNIIVQGDNLQVMKSLLPFYRGQVKCIYIDPPYNTNATFEHYNDNFPHSDWLSMMYPRLELLREFLSEDGAIFISIDDNEQAYLKIICDEIFDRKNFVVNVIWEKKYSPQNDARWLSDSHDFILIYAKDKEIWRPNLLPRTAEMDARYKNPDNDPRGPWTSGDISVKTYSPSGDYPITTPSGRVVNPPSGLCWRLSKEKFSEMLADNRIWFGAKGDNVPRIKRFLSEVQGGSVSKTIWFRDEVGDNQNAQREVKATGILFDTPKPTRLIEKILRLATDKNSLVLDAFAGSGSTAHAVLNLNAVDSGNRKFILIEEQAYCDTITAERVRRVGGDFNFYRLGEEISDAEGKINSKVTFEQLADFIWFSVAKTPRLQKEHSPLIGIYNGTAIYLLYNGILKDKSSTGENVLTRKILAMLPKYDGDKIIFGAACRLDEDFLKENKISFRQIPKDLYLN